MKAFWAVTSPQTQYEEEDEDLAQGLLAKDLPIGERSNWRMKEYDEDEDEDED